MGKSGVIYTGNKGDGTFNDEKTISLVGADNTLYLNNSFDDTIKAENIQPQNVSGFVFADDSGFFSEVNSPFPKKALKRDSVVVAEPAKDKVGEETRKSSEMRVSKSYSSEKMFVTSTFFSKARSREVKKSQKLLPTGGMSELSNDKTNTSFLQKKHSDWFSGSETATKSDSSELQQKRNQPENKKDKNINVRHILNNKNKREPSTPERKKTKKEEEGTSIFYDMLSGSWDIMRIIFAQEVILRFVIGAIAGIFVFATIFTGLGLI